MCVGGGGGGGERRRRGGEEEGWRGGGLGLDSTVTITKIAEILLQEYHIMSKKNF